MGQIRLLVGVVLLSLVAAGTCGDAAAVRRAWRGGSHRALQQAASVSNGTASESSLSARLWPVPAGYQ